MRQAGRYLPEYRKIRSQVGGFMQLCKTPELACAITLQPIERFPLDAAIVFSDILTIPDAMGLGLHFVENEGPCFKKTLHSRDEIARLSIPDMETDLGYVMDTLRLVRHELNDKIPLIGFSGSPWTLACYMIEGGASKNFSVVKKLLFQEPQTLHLLLELLAQAVTDYLYAQIQAGAQALMIFDTWGGILSPPDFHTFSQQYMAQIIHNLKCKKNGSAVPVTVFTKNGGQWLEDIADSGCDAISLDWTTTLKNAKIQVGHRVALQGNLDPSTLYGSQQRIEQDVETLLTVYDNNPGHIFNLGHGIHPDVQPENVAILVDAVHRISKGIHQKEVL